MGRVLRVNNCEPLRAGTAAILAVAASKPVVTADASGRIGVEKQMVRILPCMLRIESDIESNFGLDCFWSANRPALLRAQPERVVNTMI